MPTVIANVRPWGADPLDLELDNGLITAIRPASESIDSASGDVVDGRGRLVLPSLADTHCHLDSTRVGLPFRPHTGGPGVWAMMMNDRRNWRSAEVSIAERTTDLLGRMIARGTGLVRSFAQVDTDCGLERLQAVVAAREAHADRVEVQIVAFPQAGLLREQGSADLLEAALREGAEVVGGIDPCSLDRDPAAHLDIVFGLADKYQRNVDIHLHEPGALGRFSASLIAERTTALGMQGKVLISHGYGLFDSPVGVEQVISELAEADIALSTIAPGRAAPLPLAQLVEAGVRVGLGEDGQRDYWSPYGNADMLDRTWQLAFTQGFRPDELIEHAYAVASLGGRSIITDAAGLTGVEDRPGLSVGDPADLLLVGTETVTAAVMDRDPDRTVIKAGRVVAEGLQLL